MMRESTLRRVKAAMARNLDNEDLDTVQKFIRASGTGGEVFYAVLDQDRELAARVYQAISFNKVTHVVDLVKRVENYRSMKSVSTDKALIDLGLSRMKFDKANQKVNELIKRGQL